MADAERNRLGGTGTPVFIDEIHRFNKAQQVTFLPYVERGDISLIGIPRKIAIRLSDLGAAFAHRVTC